MANHAYGSHIGLLKFGGGVINVQRISFVEKQDMPATISIAIDGLTLVEHFRSIQEMEKRYNLIINLWGFLIPLATFKESKND
jgi:hypothetical protein